MRYYISSDQKDEILDSDFDIVFGEDNNKKTGVTWLSAKSKERLNARVLSFTSDALYTDLSGNEKFAGMSYCKLMSPVRMVEWLIHERRFIK